MKRFIRTLILSILCLTSLSLSAEHFKVGMVVLADCHGFFAKGKIKRQHKESYVIHFDKDSRPIFCVPFAWDNEFVVAYKPVQEYTGQLETSSGIFGNNTEPEVFKTGEKLKVTFKVLEKDAMFSDKYTVSVVIQEINFNGAAVLKAVAGDEKAQKVFTRWVGTNYVTLDFSRSLKADRLTFLKVEK